MPAKSNKSLTKSRIKQTSILDAVNIKFKKILKSPKIRPTVIIISFVLVGTIILIATKADTPRLSLEAENGNRSGGADRVQNSSSSGGAHIRFGNKALDQSAKRFFSDSVSWNKTVSEMGISNQFPGYTERLYKYASASGWDGSNLAIGYNPAKRGQFNIALRDYSIPIYDASEATMTRKLYWAAWAWPRSNYYECDSPGASPCKGTNSQIVTPVALDIPWSPNWKPGTGHDRMMMVIDYKTGELWTYYGTDLDPRQCTVFGDNGSGNWTMNFFDVWPTYDTANPGHICMAGVGRRTNIYTVEQAMTHTGRGMGIDKAALTVRAEEIKSGAIKHALALTIYGQMFGPSCKPNSPTTAGAGESCAFSLPPATRVEHEVTPHSSGCGGNGITANNANRLRTIPSGMRFRVNRDDNSIQSWLNKKGYTGKKRETARIIGKALVDYGFIAAAETGCGDSHFEFDGMQNPKTRSVWLNDLGLEDTGRDYTGNENGSPDGLPDYPDGDLMHGFITQENLQVVNPG